MKVAEILSDLTSLRVCGPAEALALVHASKTMPTAGVDSSPSSAQATADGSEEGKEELRGEDPDPELQRVYDLVRLHNLVKSQYQMGNNSKLQKARADVSNVMKTLREEGD